MAFNLGGGPTGSALNPYSTPLANSRAGAGDYNPYGGPGPTGFPGGGSSMRQGYMGTPPVAGQQQTFTSQPGMDPTQMYNPAPVIGSPFAALFGGSGGNGTYNGTGPSAGAAGSSSFSSPYGSGSGAFVNNPTGINTYAPGTQNGLGGQTTNYNPAYFASGQTAQSLAQATGGKVTQGNDLVPSPGSPFTLNQLENMVQLPNGLTVNAGLLNNIYSNGYNSSITNPEVANELNFGSQNNQPGKGAFTVVTGPDGQPKITYDPNGTPQMLGQSAPTPGSPAYIANTNAANQSVAQGVNPAQFQTSQMGGYTGPITSPQGQPQSQSPLAQLSGQSNFAQAPGAQSSLSNNPLFSQAVMQLFGGNPFSLAAGLSGFGGGASSALGPILNLLAGQNTQNTQGGNSNVGNILSMLNQIFSQQTNPANGVLSPLFWGQQATGGGGFGNPLNFLYPQFM